MTKQKRSFLDKIINNREGSKQEEENYRENISKEASEKNEIVEEDREKNYEPKKSDNISDVENKNAMEDDGKEIDSNKKEKEGDREEWFNNQDGNKEEGQLTIDVYQIKDCIIIKSIIGGVVSEDLDISVTGDMVTIKGKRANADEVKPDDYYYQECFWGNFSRSVILPCDIKTDEVEATMKNGILTVKLPKIEKNSSIKVKVLAE